MKIFKSYKLSWQEIGVFKLALLTIGIAIGAYWHEYFRDSLGAIAVIAVLSSAYVMYVAMKQK